MEMHKPAHPGEVLNEMYLTPLKLTVTEAAKGLNMSRKALSELVNCRTGVSTSMALKLAKAFGTTPEFWLNMQQNYDLWREKKRIKLSSVKVLLNDN
jgi:antitoxin HigA-1